MSCTRYSTVSVKDTYRQHSLRKRLCSPSHPFPRSLHLSCQHLIDQYNVSWRHFDNDMQQLRSRGNCAEIRFLLGFHGSRINGCFFPKRKGLREAASAAPPCNKGLPCPVLRLLLLRVQCLNYHSRLLRGYLPTCLPISTVVLASCRLILLRTCRT